LQCVPHHHNKTDDQTKHVQKSFRTLVNSQKKKKNKQTNKPKIIEKERDIEQLTGIMALKTRRSEEDESAKLLFSQQNQIPQPHKQLTHKTQKEARKHTQQGTTYLTVGSG